MAGVATGPPQSNRPKGCDPKTISRGASHEVANHTPGPPGDGSNRRKPQSRTTIIPDKTMSNIIAIIVAAIAALAGYRKVIADKQAEIDALKTALYVENQDDAQREEALAAAEDYRAKNEAALAELDAKANELSAAINGDATIPINGVDVASGDGGYETTVQTEIEPADNVTPDPFDRGVETPDAVI